jgi:hypothetical protein
MGSIVHPAARRWLRNRAVWLVLAVLALMVAQWLLAIRHATLAVQPFASGLARTRVDPLPGDPNGKLVLSVTWRLSMCTVYERVVFDADRAFVHPNLPEDNLTSGKVTVTYIGPCLVVKPFKPPQAPVLQLNFASFSAETAPFAGTSRAVLGCIDGSEAPRVEPWSTAVWQSELVAGWPFQWLRYRFESDTTRWPDRSRFKPVEGIRLIENIEADSWETSEFGMMCGGGETHPATGMLATRVRWLPFIAELLLATAVVLITGYSIWWLATLPTRRRLRRGLCVTCGYDMKGQPATCPECGKPARIHHRWGSLDC